MNLGPKIKENLLYLQIKDNINFINFDIFSIYSGYG